MNSLRRWWSLPVDYGWNVAYARSQQALQITKNLIGIWCWTYAVAAAVGLAIPGLSSGNPGRWTLWFTIVTAVPVGAAWLIGGWPSWRMSFVFVLYADVLLAVVLLTFDSPSVVLPLAALFTVMGSYVVGFHGPKLFTAHHVFAFVITAALYASAMVNDPAQRLQTSLYLVMLILVMFSAPLIGHSFLMLLRRDATAAFYDPLTGMLNRRGFDASIGNLRLRSVSDATVTVVLIDIDNFKVVNDRFGHQHGDSVIRSTASRILDTFPAPAVAVRLGGEEFAVASLDDPESVIERSELLRSRLSVETDLPPLTASIGVAHRVVDSRSVTDHIDELLGRADEAMYQAKRLGGNRVARSEESSGNPRSSTGSDR